jgi:hypothetical protein
MWIAKNTPPEPLESWYAVFDEEHRFRGSYSDQKSAFAHAKKKGLGVKEIHRTRDREGHTRETVIDRWLNGSPQLREREGR